MEKVKKANITERDQSKEKTVYEKKTSDYLEEFMDEQKMYGQFKPDMGEEMDKKGSGNWLRKSAHKPETEALTFTAQEQALRTKYVKFHIDKTSDSPLCRLCGEEGKTVAHIISACKKLAQKEYKSRHYNVVPYCALGTRCSFSVEKRGKVV